ncbi:MAG: cysteine--tRNA ligase [Candidatus Moranbacteria bacterium]|nr:cysteine--tRNA ligase [Candidatus Moranbacteria bacterium]
MLRFYNTLTKQKEVFEPLFPGKVGMYACGPTVYDYIHIGNLRAYVLSDTVRRVLEHAGYEVRLIRNITDVGHLTDDDVAQGDTGEDKMEKKAKAEKKTPAEIAVFYEEYFHATEARINLLPAHFYPRATVHVVQMIRMIESLIRSGHAYESNGNVFFDVTSFPDYGKLSGNSLENLKVGARLEEHPDKRNPWDFALWLKAPKDHLMHWASPWSEGYPGWHIECSAMSQEYLGDTLDIHCGGEDNIFPHHEAEIAQSECATEKPFTRYWIHNRHLLVDGMKMSKSKGNFYKLEDVTEKGYSPMDLRMLFLSSHYRSQMNFTWDSLSSAKKNKETLFALTERLESAASGTEDVSSSARAEFFEAIEDDLNTPLALAALLGFSSKANAALDAGTPIDTKRALAFLSEAFSVFGLVRETVEIPSDVRKLADERETARIAKDFVASDALRDRLLTAGWSIEDTPQGPKLKKR